MPEATFRSSSFDNFEILQFENFISPSNLQYEKYAPVLFVHIQNFVLNRKKVRNKK